MLEDARLDELLRGAAPHVTEPVGFDAHCARILAEGRRRRIARAWMGGAAAVVLFAGAGAAASAGGGNETPFGWVAANVFSFEQADGELCFQGFRLDVDNLSADADAVDVASDYLTALDLAAIDTTATEAEVRLDNAQAVDDVTGGPSPVTMSDGHIRQEALNRIVAEGLWEELADRGYPNSGIALFSSTTDCS